MKYLNDYLEKWCSCDLQALYCQSRNPAKEITESMGAYRNIQELINTKNDKHIYFCIGDGSLCMTGALLAFVTKGIAISIDPLVNLKKVSLWSNEKSVKNFYGFKTTYENFIEDEVFKFDDYTYTLICVHAHVSMVDLISKFPRWDYLYTNPCCHKDKQTLSLAVQKERNISVLKYGVDENILSDKNEVIVYKNNK